MVVFKYIFLCCKQSSSASEQNICSCMVNVAFLPLRPPGRSVQQFPHYPCNAVTASCLSKDHTRKYGVRSGLQGGCGQVIFFMGTYSYKGIHSNFLVFQYSCQEFTIVHMGKKFIYNTCLIPKDRSNDFSFWWHILFVLFGDVLCFQSLNCCLDQLYNGRHRFHSLWHFVTGNPHLWFCGDAKDQRLLPSLCLCEHPSVHRPCHSQALQ